MQPIIIMLLIFFLHFTVKFLICIYFII